MLVNNNNETTFSVPLTLKVHHAIQEFLRRRIAPKMFPIDELFDKSIRQSAREILANSRDARVGSTKQEQQIREKAKQIYLNTLAVYATHFFLTCLDYETDWEDNEKARAIARFLADTAALEVKGWGLLECRPVLPDSDTCRIPLEVWSDRRGYIAVRLDSDLKEATLLGFLESVGRKETPLSDFQSLEQAIECLSQPERIPLRDWLKGAIAVGWHAWEELEKMLPPQPPALAFRSRHGSAAIDRGKILDLQGEEVVLQVSMTPPQDSKIDIAVEVSSPIAQTYLPPDLQLILLNEEGDLVMQANAKTTKAMELEFSGILGDKFQIQVVWENTNITESFVI
ncbi:MAG: DUF1822 family protein [Cyanobacteria bacterium SBLK]|nr:DUF1822 family protein [Cyanobacteria bacterium SBLK]